MEMSSPPYVAVIGPGEAEPALAGLAEEVGRGLGLAGAVVVCGGLGGVMEAVCHGAKEAGGRTLGLLPGADRRDGNPYLDVAVATGIGEARNVLVVRASDAVIAVAGELGTLSEIGFALKIGKPVVGLGTWELSKDGRPVEAIERVATPAEAVERALALAGRA